MRRGRKEVPKEERVDMGVKCRNRRLWCPCRGEGGRRDGGEERKAKGGEIGGVLGLRIGL